MGIWASQFVCQLVDFLLDIEKILVKDFMNIPDSVGYPIFSLNPIFFNGLHQLQVKRMIFRRLSAHMLINY